MNLSHLTNLPLELVETARNYCRAKVSYEFSDVEQRALRTFFTNLDRRVFGMRLLPENVVATLLSMYSRLSKDPRGIRGVFCNKFIPGLLAAQLPEFESMSTAGIEMALSQRGIKTLGQFLIESSNAAELFERFFAGYHVEEDFWTLLAHSKKAREFMKNNYDNYGHNSIARLGVLHLCFEEISALAAKSIEWTRPGAGYVELSTRYVDMSHKGCYPIEDELNFYNAAPDLIQMANEEYFRQYQILVGENIDGKLPEYYREQYGSLYEADKKSLELGIKGESCDVAGNLLPSSVLTSVGVSVSGEAFPTLIKHLILDATSENIALAEMALEEAEILGATEFLRHYEPTHWDRAVWKYLPTNQFYHHGKKSAFALIDGNNQLTFDAMSKRLKNVMHLTNFYRDQVKRGDFDKLPYIFEQESLAFYGVMSFRSWRDLHRMQLATHARTYVTPDLGFYHYDKLAPPDLKFIFKQVTGLGAQIYRDISKDAPKELLQYVLPMGFRVGVYFAANLRELEFCLWQRSAPSVNHEVRQCFLVMYQQVTEYMPEWASLARTDITPAYIFARGEPKELTDIK